tara:strand:+ start:1078 stop:2088 length:1011 start_codon:yes stop_codon:yes gene_type:complete
MKNNVIIIAEAGVNHNGSIETAKKLIDAAAHAGADFVKFQTFISEEVISKNAKKANYQIRNTKNTNESQLEMVKKLELSRDEHFELKEYCNTKKIKFLSTAFDLSSIELLKELKVPFFKIPSGEITNLPYLRKAAKDFNKFIISTGMSNIGEINDALNVLKENKISKNKIVIMHCNTQYPTPMKNVNLKAMLSIKKEFNVNIGYSDHTQGIEVPIAAVAMGASVIEKHFTLNKNMAGPDHKASLNPSELKEMVTAIRNIQTALGNEHKEPSIGELRNINIARKSIVAIDAIKKGDIFSDKNISCKRPGDGISPMKWDSIIGKKSKYSFKKDDLIKI